MAPPSTKPILRSIDPEALAAEVHGRAADTLHVLAAVLGYEVREVSHSDVRQAVRRLALYARDGAPLDSGIGEYLISLIPLWQAPRGEALDPLDAEGYGEADDALGIVMQAALAREAVDEGRPTTLVRLAALASMSPRQVQVLAKEGQIRAEDGEVAAKDARKWLQGRGVPGYAGKRR